MAESQTQTVEVRNTDVKWVVDHIKVFVRQMEKSSSARHWGMNTDDQKRAKQYIDRTIKAIEHVISQPDMDTPQTDPESLDILPLPSAEEIVSPAVRRLVRYFRIMHNELVRSQSAQQSGGLSNPDVARARNYMARATNLIDTYVAGEEAMDIPEGTELQEERAS